MIRVSFAYTWDGYKDAVKNGAALPNLTGGEK